MPKIDSELKGLSGKAIRIAKFLFFAKGKEPIEDYQSFQEIYHGNKNDREKNYKRFTDTVKSYNPTLFNRIKNKRENWCTLINVDVALFKKTKHWRDRKKKDSFWIKNGRLETGDEVFIVVKLKK